MKSEAIALTIGRYGWSPDGGVTNHIVPDPFRSLGVWAGSPVQAKPNPSVSIVFKFSLSVLGIVRKRQSCLDAGCDG